MNRLDSARLRARRFTEKPRSAFPALLFVLLCGLPLAHARERPGDIAAADALRKQAIAATAIQKQLLAIAEAAPPREQFERYRTHDATIGAWAQVAILRSLLDAAIGAASAGDERRLRMDLRDCARFAVWELDQSIADLDATIARGGPAAYSRLLERLRFRTTQARIIARRLAFAG